MKQPEASLRKHLSPLGAWAFSIGTSIGWGSLVVTSNTYLAQAGPWGSVLGLCLGALVMVVVACCYAYLMRSFPEAGGAFAFTREVFGYDQSILTAWFLAMTYFAVLWANATSLPLFARIFLGGVFRFGRLYTLFGYEVYLGEALLSAAALTAFGFLCARYARAVDRLMIGLALLFGIGIIACFFGALSGDTPPLSPAYIPDTSALGQVVYIAVISPWAFIGFESISHASEEFRFGREKIRGVLLVSVLSTLALYICVTLLSVLAYPARYDNWLAYIRDLESCEGLEALPAFYAAEHYLGRVGTGLLMLSLLALIVTSLIGNMTALSRLFYALAKNRILPERYAALNKKGIPARAVTLVVAFSILIPLVGRTAIGWIVDVTTIGATLIYGFVCAATAVLARDMGEKRPMWLGRVGLAVLAVFGMYILAPNLVGRGSIARETYFLFIMWSVLGFLVFRSILRRDRERRFGGSYIVWVALLALVLLLSLIWMRQSMIAANDQMLDNIQRYYDTAEETDEQRLADQSFIREQMEEREAGESRAMLMVLGMFGFALVIMLTNHSTMNRRSKENEQLANTDPMTGVKSKLAYLSREKEIDVAIEGKWAESFSLVVCDVNGLKRINDTQGHKAGDEYIRAACRLICEIFQHSPVYRVGGDEFVVLLTGRDHAVRADLLNALHNRSVEHISSGGAVVSGGLSDYRPGTDLNMHDVFERADGQMYEEKQLLKSLGSVTRDEESEETTGLLTVPDESPAVINIRRKLLIVEDEAPNRLLLGSALEDSYELLYAADGVEAIEQLTQHAAEIALVLLDLILPRLSGIEVLRRIKSDEELRHIPVIVVTSDQSAEVQCLKLGAMDFISKPCPQWEIVRARVNKCVEFSENRDIIQSTERDQLTRLFNVDYFLRYVEMFDRHYWEMPMDAVVIEMEHFHMLTERFGKQYGDKLLRRLGQKVRQAARELGGVGCRQEASFLLYCPHREDYGKLLGELGEGLDTSEAGDPRLRLGVYVLTDKNLGIEQRFERAKLAAETVKSGYGRRIGLYDARMYEAALYRERLLEDFRRSLEEKRFTVYFQPKYDIRAEQPVLCGAEALVRWNHPTYGLVSPADFIPLLEENGLVIELDKHVWREAAERIREWKTRLGHSIPVSVNVSRIDMLTPGLKDVFTGIVEACGLDNRDLVLEITETAYAADSGQVIATARELHDMGVGFRIEMDDFGTGYSSLSMLSQLPIDALKLDMRFVQNAFRQERDVRLIELILDVAAHLQVPVVAEGVETEEQYRTLRSLGCQLAQGYYFSPPRPRRGDRKAPAFAERIKNTPAKPSVRRIRRGIID